MQRSAASHLGLHCLLRPVCPNTYSKYGTTESMCSRTEDEYDVHNYKPHQNELHLCTFNL